MDFVFEVPVEQRKGKKRFFALLAVLLPPIGITLYLSAYLEMFLGFMLDYGCLFLSFIPLFLVWRLRYKELSSSPHLLFGGKRMLYFLFVGLFYLIWIQGLMPFIKILINKHNKLLLFFIFYN